MIVPKQLESWFRHRAGFEQLTPMWSGQVTEALEANKNAQLFLDTYGNGDIAALIGFADLAGFSDAVKGREPGEVAGYCLGFLNPITGAVVREEDWLTRPSVMR